MEGLNLKNKKNKHERFNKYSKSEKEGFDFYTEIYKGNEYKRSLAPEDHPFFKILKNQIEKFNLKDSKALEVGAGTGELQDVLEDYTGIDITDTLKPYFHKTFVKCSATNMSFHNESFDLIWSYAALEHIPNPEKALLEIMRVLKPEGILLLMPAWQCRTWAAKGYPVRPYSDFNLWGKIIKFSIPFRNLVIIRSLYIFPKRVFRIIFSAFSITGSKLHYKKLKPNYDKFWMSDSDAINSMDPFNVIQWYEKIGLKCINYNTFLNKFFVRTGLLIFKKVVDKEKF